MRVAIGLAVLAMVAAPVSAAVIELGGAGNNVNWDDNPGSAAPWTGPAVAADGTPGPAWADGLLAPSGQWYGGVQQGGAQNPVTTDNVVAVAAGDTVNLTGWMFIGTWNDQVGVVQILDSDGTTVLDEMVIDTRNGVPLPYNSGWVPLTSGNFNIGNLPPAADPVNPGTLSGVASGSSVTVRVGWIGNTGAWSNGTGVYMDAVPEPTSLSLVLFAGLPLLLRRKR
jgi:hypothetical protein